MTEAQTAAATRQTVVLFVCTANQCRSPFAEAIARRHADPRTFVIGSAGLLEGGRPVPPNGLLVAAELGFDLSGHRSRHADRQSLRESDVILTMTREHVRELVAADPTLWPRVFTIKQFRRWIQNHPPEPGTRLGEWIDLAAAGRSRYDAVGASADDDIDDPVIAPPAQWRTMAAGMDAELGAVFAALGRR